jgi:type IV pilus assembly protein PilB
LVVTHRKKRLGEMLIEEGLIKKSDLEKALAEQKKKSNRRLGQIMIEMKLISEEDIASMLGRQLGIPFITLSHYEIDKAILKTIPTDVVRKYQIIPVDRTGNTLTVALADPSNIFILDEIKLLTKCEIVPLISYESDIKQAIVRYYEDDSSAFEEMMKDITDAEDIEVIEVGDDIDEDKLREQMEEAPVIKLVNLLITQAIKDRVSDIHIEPYEKDLRVRYRIDGVLHEVAPPHKSLQNAIISRLKIISDLDIAERRLPQDGRFKMRFTNREIDFRVSVLPTSFGEKVVMRLLDKANLNVDLKQLGFEDHEMKTIDEQIHAPYGMILVTGPTGSGKSTTLYSILSTINDPKKNIMTAEDPVEYQLKGINQVQTRADIGLTFAAALRSFLRQDPDIVMVGEMRDLETTEIGVKAALTGHLVLSTLHTNDSPSTITRLVDMGIERFLVSSSLNMIIAQRLVRRNCKSCMETYTPSIAMLKNLGIPGPAKKYEFARGAGCDICKGTGYKGRVALYEILVMSENLRDLVVRGANMAEIKIAAREEGMKTLRDSGINKIISGLTTAEEVLSVSVANET